MSQPKPNTTSSKLPSNWEQQLPEETHEAYLKRVQVLIPAQPPDKQPELFYQALFTLSKHGAVEQAKMLLKQHAQRACHCDPYFHQSKATLAWFSGDLGKAEQEIRKSLELFEAKGYILQILKSRIRLASIIGRSHQEKGTSLILQALEQATQLGLLQEQGLIHTNISALYLDCGDFTKTLTHARLAQSIRKRLNEEDELTSPYNNETLALINMGDFDGAFSANTHALQKIKQKNTPQGIRLQIIRARLLLLQGEPELAQELLEQTRPNLHHALPVEHWLYWGEIARLMLFKETSEKTFQTLQKVKNLLANPKLDKYPVISRETRHLLSQLYIKAGFFDEAKQLLYALIEEHPQLNIYAAKVRLTLTRVPGLETTKAHALFAEVESFAIQAENLPLQILLYEHRSFLSQMQGDLLATLSNTQTLRKLEQYQYKKLRSLHQEVLLEEQKQERLEAELQKTQMELHQVQYDNQMVSERLQLQQEALKLLAHDIRNPLFAIKLYLEQLKKIEDLQNNQSFQQVFRSTQQISELITQLVQTIRHPNSPPAQCPILVQPLFSSVYRDFQFIAEGKDIRILLQVPAHIKTLADPIILRRALDNLVSNALKFSPPHQSIWLIASQSEDCIQLQIRDEGPGLSKEEQEKLFKAFSKVGPVPTAGESSLGLGLYLTKNQLEKINGSLFCTSVKGHGATFTIELPAYIEEKVK